MENVYSIKKKSNKPLEIDAQQRVSAQATVKHRQFILFKPGCYFCWAQLSFFVGRMRQPDDPWNLRHHCKRERVRRHCRGHREVQTPQPLALGCHRRPRRFRSARCDSLLSWFRRACPLREAEVQAEGMDHLAIILVLYAVVAILSALSASRGPGCWAWVVMRTRSYRSSPWHWLFIHKSAKIFSLRNFSFSNFYVGRALPAIINLNILTCISKRSKIKKSCPIIWEND